MDKKSITQAIVNRVESSKTVDYSAWTIGLTHDPANRKQQHESEGKSTKYWEQWIADSMSDPQDSESYFINNGIVLLDRIKIEIEEFKKPESEAIIAAAKQRFRPILLTTATTSLGLIPL